jgi:hypothetical protein
MPVDPSLRIQEALPTLDHRAHVTPRLVEMNTKWIHHQISPGSFIPADGQANRDQRSSI